MSLPFPQGVGMIWLGGFITLVLFFLSKADLKLVVSPLLVSQISAVTGAYLLSVTFILSSRWPGLEFWFGGLDRVYRLHHRVGKYAFTFITLHLLGLLISAVPRFSLLSQYVLPDVQNIPYSLGIFAFWILTTLIVLTLWVKLPYHIWYATHEWFASVALLAFFHVYLIDSDVSVYVPLKYWLLSCLLIASGASLYKRFLYRLIGPSTRYTIKRMTETQGVVSMYLSPLSKHISFHPGQFVFLETPLSPEHHPFSMASSPHEPFIRLMPKKAGDYTTAMTSLQAKNRVKLYGPYGGFMRQINKDSRIVMVAGGIGITPFLSLTQQLTFEPDFVKDAVLIHSVSNPAEAIEGDALKKLDAGLANFRYVFHPTSSKGRLTGESIIETAGKKRVDYYYICGPRSMMLSLRDQLTALGISRRIIIFEDFSLK